MSGSAHAELRDVFQFATVAAHHALYRDERETFEETARRHSYAPITTREIADLFHSLRKFG